jgi:hypothetical protein
MGVSVVIFFFMPSRRQPGEVDRYRGMLYKLWLAAFVVRSSSSAIWESCR